MGKFDDNADRERKRAIHEVLPAVLAAGEALGLWKAEPREEPTQGHNQAWAYVTDAEGLRYSIGAGGWDCNITASVAHVTRGPHRVHVSDVRTYGKDETENPSAACTLKRSPEAIAKDLHRRVIVPGAPRARAVLAEAERRVSERAKLCEVAAKLEAMGLQARIADGQTYSNGGIASPEGCSGLYNGRFDSRGYVTFDSVGVPVEKLPALLALLRA